MDSHDGLHLYLLLWQSDMLLQKTEYDEAKEVNKLVVGECNFPPLSFIGGMGLQISPVQVNAFYPLQALLNIAPSIWLLGNKTGFIVTMIYRAKSNQFALSWLLSRTSAHACVI